MRGRMVGLLPVGIQDWLRRSRDEVRLRKVAREACVPGGLGPLDADRLRTMLSASAADQDWARVEAEMAALGITASAHGVNPGDRRALYQLVRGLKPVRLLEVGTHIGASTAHLAAALRDNAAAGAPAATLTTVDIVDVNDPVQRPWVGYGAAHSPAELMRRLGMAERVRFVAQPSLAFLQQDQASYDFIFLDGDHSAATVYRELPAALARLAPGGFLLLHDYFPEARPLWPGDPVIAGVWLAAERLRAEGARFTVLPLGDLPWPTKLGRNVTSLAAVALAT